MDAVLKQCCLEDLFRNLHREIGVLATELGFKHMVAIGRFSHFYQQSFSAETVPFKTTLEARDFVRSLQPKCEALFIKGSRSLQLESLLDIK